jgi:hypothetical protein
VAAADKKSGTTGTYHFENQPAHRAFAVQRRDVYLASMLLAVSAVAGKTPFDKPDVPAIEAPAERLNQRPAFFASRNNGMI